MKCLLILKKKFVPPVSDLKEYMNENNDLNISKYLTQFNNQIDNNYSNLEKLELVNTKLQLIDLMKNIETISKSKSQILLSKIFTPDVISFIRQVLDNVNTVKNTIIDLSFTLSEHSCYVKDILESQNVSPALLSVVNRAEYYEKHKDIFKKYFESGVNPEYPFSVPHLIELRDNMIKIINDEEYNEMKNKFQYFKEKVDLYISLSPKTWPVLVPNLSTHNGEPKITIKNSEDLLKIVTHYNRFINRMNGLARGWSVLIRKLFEFGDLMNQILDQCEIIIEENIVNNNDNEDGNDNHINEEVPKEIKKKDTKRISVEDDKKKLNIDKKNKKDNKKE